MPPGPDCMRNRVIRRLSRISQLLAPMWAESPAGPFPVAAHRSMAVQT
jgi:hypothetical protein